MTKEELSRQSIPDVRIHDNRPWIAEIRYESSDVLEMSTAKPYDAYKSNVVGEIKVLGDPIKWKSFNGAQAKRRHQLATCAYTVVDDEDC